MRRNSSRSSSSSSRAPISDGRARSRHHTRRRRRLCVLEGLDWERVEERTLLSTITWASDVGGDWDNPSMWTGGVVPGPSDDAVVGFSDITVTHATSASDSVNSLTSEAAIAISGGSLSLGSASSISNTLSLSSGATLAGAGNVTVSGLFDWQGGTIQGPAGSTLTAQGGAALHSPSGGALILDGRTFNNAATATWSDAGISFQDDAVFHNLPGATFDDQTNSNTSSAGLFINDGLFEKSGNTGPLSDTELNVPFDQSSTGSVSVLAGSLSFLGGGQEDGSFTGDAGTTLSFGGQTFTATSSIAGDTVSFSGGDTIAGSYSAQTATVINYGYGAPEEFTGTVSSVGSLTFVPNANGNAGGIADFSPASGPTTLTLSGLTLTDGATLTGSDNFVVTANFDWQGGTIQGPAGSTLTAQGGAALHSPSGGALILDGRTFNNAATATWSDAGISFQDGAVFHNLPGATFDDQTNSNTSSAGLFINDGLFEKSGNTGPLSDTELNVPFDQSSTGSVSVLAGSLSFLGGGQEDGSFTGDAGTTLSFGGQTFTATSSIAGDTVSFSGGDTIAGSYSAQTATVINYGYGAPEEFTGTVTSVGSLTFVPYIYGGASGGIADFSPASGPTTLTLSGLTLTDGATLTGSDNFVVTANFDWQGGTIQGPAGSTLTAQGGAALHSPSGGALILDGRTFNNAATATWSDAGISFQDGAVFHNLPGATFDDQTNSNTSSAGLFINDGLFEKSGNTGPLSDTELSVPFDQSSTGSVSVLAGSLSFLGGGQEDGSFTGDAGTTLSFNGQTFTPTSTIAGDTVSFSGGDTIAGSYSAQTATVINYGYGAPEEFIGTVTSVGSLTFAPDVYNLSVGGIADFSPASGPTTLTLSSLTLTGGATLTGSDSFVVTGAFNWADGTLAGPSGSSLTALGGIALDESPAAASTHQLVLDGRTLNNGDPSHTGASAALTGGGVTLDHDAVFNNYGSFDVVTAANTGYFEAVTAAATFNNYGSFVKSGDSETAVFMDYGGLFNNSGSVVVDQGGLDLTGGTSSGSYTGAAGTTLSFNGQTFTPTSTIAGDTVSFSGGDTIAGSYSAQTATVINYGYGAPEEFIGTVTSVGSLTFAPDVYNLSVGGIADFSPASGPTTLTLSSLTLTGGATLTGSDSFVVTGAFNWADGTLAGPSGSSLTALGGIALDESPAAASTHQLVLDGRTLNNGDPSHTGASAALTGGGVTLDHDAVFNNYGSFDVVTAANTGYFEAVTAAATFNNYGSFVKSGDSETAVFMDYGGLFNNSGSVVVDQGGLDLTGGTSSGSYTGAAGTTLSFNGQTFTPTSTIAGDTVSFSGGDTIAGSYSAQTATVINYGYGAPEEFIGTVTSVGSLTFAPDVYNLSVGGIADFSPASGPTTLTLSSLTLTGGATLTGSDSFVVTGAFNWADGTLAGPSGSSLTALGGIALDESPAAASTHQLVLDGRTLNNGDPSHTGASAALTGGGVTLDHDAVFNNYGSFDVVTAANTGYFEAVTAAATFNNYGSFVKSGDSETAVFMDYGGLFNNSGSVVVDQGGLDLTGGTSSGSYTGAAGTTLSFNGQTFTPTSTIAGDTVSFSGGDTIAGSYSAQTATVINYGYGAPEEFIGTVTSVGSLTFAPDVYNLSVGGIADFSPASGPTTLTLSSLTLTGGATLTGSDSFVVTGAFNWADGTLAGPSGSSLTALGGIALDESPAAASTHQLVLDGRTLNNGDPSHTGASAALTGGGVTLDHDAVFNNYGSFDVVTAANTGYFEAVTAAATFNNYGSFVKSGDSETAVFMDYGGLFNNSGSVVVDQGGLDLTGGTSSGSYTGAAGTTLSFNGQTFTPTSTIAGDTVSFSGGDTIAGSYSAQTATVINYGYGAPEEFIGTVTSVGSLTFAPDVYNLSVGGIADFSPASGPTTLTLSSLTLTGGATLTGSDSFVVTGAFNWADGTLAGPSGSSLTALGGIALDESPAAASTHQLVLDGRTLNNGDPSHTGASAALTGGGVTLDHDAVFNNYGSFDVVTAANTGYFEAVTAAATFNNYGSFVKSGDSETAVFMDYGGLFNNSGSVVVDQGGLDLTGGTSSGSYTGAAGTTLSFNGQTFTPTSTIAGDTVSFSGGDTIAGSYSAQTATVINYGYGAPEEFIGTVTSVGSLTFAPDVYNLSVGGIADFSPASGPTTLTLSSLTLTGGATLTGSDSFVVTGAFNWADGTLAGPSGSSLTALGGIALDESPAAASTHQLVLDGRTLNNGDPSHTGASAALTGGGVTLDHDAVFNNYGSFDVVTAANTGYFEAVTAAATFNNYGSFVKSGDSETAVFMDYGGLFNNSGSVVVDQGGLDLTGGTSSGSYTGAAGTTLSFNGQTFTPTSTIAGDTVSFSGGDTIAGSYSAQTATVINYGYGAPEEFIGTVTSVGSLTFAPDVYNLSVGGIADFSPASGPTTLTLSSLTLTGGATLTGSDSFVVTGAFNWADGTLAGPSGSSLTALGGIAMDTQGAPFVLDGRTLNNGDPAHTGATTNYTSEVNYGPFVVLQDAAVFNNYGSFNVIAAPFSGSFSVGPGGAVFNNYGTFTKVSGTDTMNYGGLFNNSGSVVVDQGGLALSGGTSSGSYTGAAGTTLSFNGQTFTPTSTIAGDTVSFSGGDTIAGSYSAQTATVINYGYGAPEEFIGTVTSVGSLTFVPDANGNAGGIADFSPASGPTTLTLSSLTLTDGATLTGSDSFVVTGPFTWTDGTLAGPGGSSLTALGGIAMDTQGAPFVLDGRTLNNGDPAHTGATTNYTSEVNYGPFVVLQDAAVFNNYGSFNVIAAPFSGSFSVGPGGAVFDNYGTFTKVSGTDTMNYGGLFNNSGSVVVDQGGLDLTGGTSSGSYTGAAGTTLSFNGQTFTPTSTIAGDTVSFSGGDTIAGSYSAQTATVINYGYGAPEEFIGTVTSVGSLTFAPDVYNLSVGGIADFSPASGPTTLTLSSLTLTGGATLTGSDSFVVTGPFTWTDGTLAGPGGSSLTALGGIAMDTQGAPFVLDGRTLNNGDPAHTGATTNYTSEVNYGPFVVLQDAAVFNNYGSFNVIAAPFSGSFSVGPGGAVFDNYGTFTKVSGTDTMNYGGLFNNTGSVVVDQGGLNLSSATNTGTIAVASGTTLGLSGYTQTAGSTVLNGGTINGGSLGINGGTLTGTGTINANVANGGQVIPGGTGAAGTLAINGNYTQTASGSLNLDLGGTTADSQYDQLAVSGAVAPGGTLNVATINSFQPALGNAFQVLTYGSSSGNFTAYNGLNLGGGRFLDPVFSPSNLTLDTDQVAISGAPAFPLEGAPISLTGSVTGPSAGNFYPTGFSWTVSENGNPFQSGSGSTFAFTPNVSATYLVTLTVADAVGGMGTATLQIVVAPSIIVLDPTAGGALNLSGNASINLAGGVFVDSSSSTALSASGNAAIKASVIDVHGGVQKSGNASFSPAPITGAPTLVDPLTGLAPPSYSGTPISENLSGNSTATINPGVYSKITVSGNASLMLAPGIYIIAGGGLSVSGNASVAVSGPTSSLTGTGVMIYNTKSSAGTYSSVTLSGNGAISLTAPTTGTYAGILIFQDRANAKALTVSGNAMEGMAGTIYAPAAQLAESGNAQIGSTSNPVSIIVDTLTISGNGIANAVALSSPSGTVAYTPAQIRAAYGISALPLDGTGQTIAIVDAYDDPSIDQALDGFDSQFGLTSSGPTLYAQYGPASSFLTVLNQYGQATSLPSTDPNGPGTDNWEVEESLDVEWAHATAPGAQIILVEANSQSLSDLMASVATAAALPGVSVVSMSWGFPEGQAVFASDEAAYDSVFTTPGVTFVASTGDYGAADPEYPAFSPNVVAVGGTSLTLNADNSYNSETGWGYYSSSAGAFIGSGGGISLYEPEPAYQRGVQSTAYRTTPDVSLLADPATGAWIADPYNLDPRNPFEVVGGTSLSAPAWAGMFALVNQGRVAAGESALNSSTPTDTQQALYMLPQNDYNVIASGTNGYTTAAGYNLVTGLGTPVANLVVPDLIAYHGPATSYSGPTVGPLQDATLVNTGTNGSGPMDVFSVFDSLAVASNELGGAQGQAFSTGLGSPPAETLAPAGAGRIAASPLISPGITYGPAMNLSPVGLMPLAPAAVASGGQWSLVSGQWSMASGEVNSQAGPESSPVVKETGPADEHGLVPWARSDSMDLLPPLDPPPQPAEPSAQPAADLQTGSQHPVIRDGTARDNQTTPMPIGHRSHWAIDAVLDALPLEFGVRSAGRWVRRVDENHIGSTLSRDGGTVTQMVVGPVQGGSRFLSVSAIPTGKVPVLQGDSSRRGADFTARLGILVLAAGLYHHGSSAAKVGSPRTGRSKSARRTSENTKSRS